MSTPQPPPPDWTIRPYQPGDEAHLVRLFEQSFGHAITEDHWRWKLKHLPSPVENVWVAVHDGTPIFQYGGIPCRFHLPGGEQVAMISVDGMTAPAFRRRGILTHTGRFLFDTWQNAGIPFTLGLPNEQWGSRTQALGWKALFPLQWLVRPLRPTTLLARRLHVPFLAHRAFPNTLWNRFWNRTLSLDPTVDVRPVDEAGSAFDHLWRACAPDITISVVRDHAWVTWRYLAAPSIDYRVLLATRARQPVGYLAYRIKETLKGKLGFIAEVFTPRTEERGRATLVRHALEALQGEAVDAVFTLATPKTPLFRFFRRAGFVFSPGTFTVQMIPLATPLPIETFRNPHNWHLTGGDFDVV